MKLCIFLSEVVLVTLNIEDIRKYINEEVFFTSEATRYLGISTQRLHQLIQSGKITPVKASKAGSLFLKEELDERLKELAIFEHSPVKKVLKSTFLDSAENNKVLYEAINFFTVQALNNNSQKKTRPIFEELNLYFDTSVPFHDNFNDIAGYLKVDQTMLEKEYFNVLRGFEQLEDNDHLVKIGQDYYPSLLAKTETAPVFLFMRGNVNLINYPAVAVVGTRNPSMEGEKRANVLSQLLGKNKIVVASGLAKGIDSAAHLGALNSSNNPTIAVIGTPLTKVYPRENIKLQEEISDRGLVISQFPPSMAVHRWNFPLRNATMSGISLATVIIEAGETSGALIQADYALKQDRFVFIPKSALENDKLKWPKKYITREGAASFSNINELMEKLESSKVISHLENKPLRNSPAEGTFYVHRS